MTARYTIRSFGGHEIMRVMRSEKTCQWYLFTPTIIAKGDTLSEAREALREGRKALKERP